MTRNLQRNRQGVATCQKRLFRNQMEKLFLSLSPSISLRPRYFCSLKSLAKLGPYYSCTSKLKKKKKVSQNLSKIYPALDFSSLHFPLLESCFPTCERHWFCKDYFLQTNSFHTSFLSPIYCFLSACFLLYLTVPVHSPPFQPLLFSLSPAH